MGKPASVWKTVCGSMLLATLVGATVVARDRFGDELSTEQFGRDRTVDVEHYRLDLEFDPEQRSVGGAVSVRVRPLNDGLSVIELDAKEMQIASVELEGVEQPRELLFRHDGETLSVGLPRPYDSDESVTVVVRYTTEPRWGLHFVGPDAAYPDRPAQLWSQGESDYNHYWFPSFDYPNDRATWEQLFTVPAAWTAIGNGELLTTRENADEGTRTFHYAMTIPNVSYLVSVIAGEFEKYEQDFDGIPVEYFVPPGTGREMTLRSFGETPDMLRFFSEKTGVRYPYAKYAQSCAVEFIHGGMENVSATTNTAETLHDSRAALEYDSLGLVAHEAAHQWFGDLLTCSTWSHAWLNEGFATYWENLWFEAARGEDEFLYRMLEDRDAYLAEDRNKYRRALVEHRFTDPMDLFDSHLYPKGAWVLHMMRGVLGDERFFKAMQHYTRTYREQVVETDDLRRAVTQATGVNMERFFLQWTRRGGYPEIAVDRDWDEAQGVLTLHFVQKQEVDDLTPIFHLPIDVAVDTATETVRRRVNLSHTEQDVTLRLDSEPLLVRIDPEFRVLMELDLERTTAELLRALAEDESPIGRILAIRDLAKQGSGSRAASGLAGALEDDAFYGVRIEAARALGVIRGESARDSLIIALGDADARVRRTVARLLGGFRDDPFVVSALTAVLESERAYGTYAAAVLSLAKIGAADAKGVALRALEIDSYREWIRVAALKALGELGDKEFIPLLREWTAYGKPPAARPAAIAALAKLSQDPEEHEKAVKLLVDLLDDRYIWARRGAMQALGELNAGTALGALTRSANVEADSRLRSAARAAIRRIRAGESGGATVEELSAEVGRLREQIRHQGGRIEEIEKRAP